jgi:hypothetical protein
MTMDLDIKQREMHPDETNQIVIFIYFFHWFSIGQGAEDEIDL